MWGMTTASVDERGRLYLPKSLREQYGGQFRIVRLYDGITLLPVPEDPVEDLSEALEPLKHLSHEEIDRAIKEEAMAEVLDDLR